MDPREHDIMRAVEDAYWWYGALRRHVVESIPETPHMRILDAGCGSGGMLNWLRARFPNAELVGIDQSPHAIEITAARQAGATLIRSEVERLPFDDESVDCVLSLDVITAVNVDPAAAVREMRRVLRSGGRSIINVAAFRWLAGAHDVAVDVNRRFTRGELNHLLSANGFAVERSTYWNATLLPFVAIARWLSRRKMSTAPRSDFRPLPPSLNAVLREFALLEFRLSRYVSLPFGTSVFAVARRN